MKIQIRYFASIRERLGHSSETLDTNAANLGGVRAQLIARGTPYAECLARGKAVRMALNQVLCEETTPLCEGAEVAFFPPVTGG